jgi:hypothetical protein
MGTLLKLVILLVLWQTGILSDLFVWFGMVLIWVAAFLHPTAMFGVW